MPVRSDFKFAPHLFKALLCSSLLLAANSHACGPDFAWRLLENRSTALQEMPETNFQYEMAHWATPLTGLPKITDNGDNWRDPELPSAQMQIEKKLLISTQFARLDAIRPQLGVLSDAQIRQATQGFPISSQLYLLGAAAFAQGDLALAQQYFLQVLALPKTQQQAYGLWAQYSLARSFRLQSMPDAALQTFQKIQQQVMTGTPDPLNLGISSLGEQARLHLEKDNRPNAWGVAIDLYAQQYAQGDMSGYASLKLLVKQLLNLPTAQLQAQLQSPQVQRLLVAWLLSTFSNYGYENSGGILTETEVIQHQQVVRLLAAQPQLNSSAAQLEKLAALLYQNGLYDSSAALLPKLGDTGLAWWLRAKTALRVGQLSEARAAYAKAAQAFPKDQVWGDRYSSAWSTETLNPHCRVQAEQAVLSLNQGDYVEAFDQLWQANQYYWQDAADIAERVLTLDELKQYVDQKISAPSENLLADRNQDGKIDDTDQYYPLPNSQKMRELLGRRMLRDGRYANAPAYFRPELRAAAKQYIEARQAAESRWQLPISRAQHLYAAATLARTQGLELLGYENAPDYAIWDGGFGGDDSSQKAAKDQWLTTDELKRQQHSKAKPNVRWHYRNIAAELANQAADGLPPRSQAFAATLCHASQWMSQTDLVAMRGYYQRYLNQGAYVPWGADFGKYCPEPEFNQAQTHQLSYVWYDLKPQLRPYKSAIYAGLGGSGVLLLGGIGWLIRRRISN